jgi:hypothetical protein
MIIGLYKNEVDMIKFRQGTQTLHGSSKSNTSEKGTTKSNIYIGCLWDNSV